VRKPRRWGEAVKRKRCLPRPWSGLDTERDSSTGEFVCGWTVGDTGVKRFGTLRDLERGLYWVYNLAYDIEGMLRDLGIEEGWAARQDGASFELDGLTCVYYHGKRFEYGDLLFLDASAFFGRVPLRKLGAKGGVDASKMSLVRYCDDLEYQREVDSYCIQDSRIVYDAMNRLDLTVQQYGLSLGSTPGATAKRFLGTVVDSFPSVVWKTQRDFLKSYGGGRFELVKRGVFHDVRQYDISSAYPWALTKCPFLTGTAYARTVRRVTDSALYGSYFCDFDMGDFYLGLGPVWKNGIRVYSSQENGAWLARPEVLWLQEHGFSVDVRFGTEIYDSNASDSWARCITGLYDDKSCAVDDFGKWGPKILMNTQYGVLIQLVRRAGKWAPIPLVENPVDFAGSLAYEAPPNEFEAGQRYAPVYAGHLTSLVRVRILDAALETGLDNYIGGHTDSVLTTGRLAVSAGLGGWELEKEASVSNVCKTGFYSMDGKVKMRGITRDGNPGMLWEPKLTRNSRCGMKTAKDWSAVSVISPKTVVNNFTVEVKRDWDSDLDLKIIERGEWIDSKPWCHVVA
jgi:hypothetical protein